MMNLLNARRARLMPGRRALFTKALAGIRRLPLIPIVILMTVVTCAVFAPLIAPYDPAGIELANKLSPVFWQERGTLSHPLGTDNLGRDILSRLIWGARVSLIVGILAIGLSGVSGSIIGTISAYCGGKVDSVIMRIVDIQMSIPALVLALMLSAVLSPGLRTVIIVIGFVYWTWYARIIRGEALSLKQRDFIALAKVAGASGPRIVFREMLPNLVNSFIILATLQLGAVIIFEASLSFLGLGVQPPACSWGLMLADGRGFITVAWWLITLPGIAIMLTVLACNLLGDWLRDYFDPKRRQL